MTAIRLMTRYVGMPRLLYRALVLTWIILGSVSLRGAMAEPLKMGGTGSGLGAMQLLAEAFEKVNPQFSLQVAPNLGSTGSIKALAAGMIDLAVTSRLPKEVEAAQGLVGREYGKTPFVLVTKKKGVSNLTLEEIARIYAGAQTTWADGSPIRLVLRPATDGDTALLGSFSEDIKRALDLAMAKEGMVIALTDQDSANDIQRLPGALGTSSLALILAEKRPLTPLAINRVLPSVETLANGSYPYYKSLYVITKGTPDGPLASFLDFLFSSEGQAILRATGHWVGALAAPKL